MGQGVPVRVHGTDAILTVGAYLPDVCVKCGRKEGLVRRNLNLVRHPLWLYGLLALGLVPYLVARTGLTQGSASMCLCPLCLGRYSSAGMAEVVLAMPITGGLLVMGTVLSGVNDALGLGLLLVGLFVFAVGAAASWVVLSQFVYPRQLQLEERRGFEMRVSGFDSDALAECAAYARYWAGVQAQQYGYGQAYGPAASYVPPHYGTSPVAGYAPPAYAPPASPAVDPAAAIAPPAHVPSVAPPVEVEAEGSPAPHDASAADPAKVEQAAGVMPSSKDDVGLHDGATKPSPAAVEAPSQEAASTTTD